MTAVVEEQTIYPPEPGTKDVDAIREVVAALAARIPTLNGPHGSVQLPHDLYEVLVNVVDALSQGLAVSVTPHHTTVTTQQAADILGVARTTVVRWIDEGRLPAEKLAKHRRLLLSEVMAYKERRRREQHDALDEIAHAEAEAGLTE